VRRGGSELRLDAVEQRVRVVELSLQPERARDLRSHFQRLRRIGRPFFELGTKALLGDCRLAEIPLRVERGGERCVRLSGGVGKHRERGDEECELAHYLPRTAAAARRSRARASAAAMAAWRFARSSVPRRSSAACPRGGIRCSTRTVAPRKSRGDVSKRRLRAR
jgi:hypothetical protein